MVRVGGWITGVYCLLNRVNGKVYVGSAAVSLGQRIRQHRKALKGGYHDNSHLQRAWNKYGAKAFIFCILEKCHPSLCLEREQHWIDHYQAFGDGGYNLRPRAENNLGLKLSIESRQKMSRSRMGRKASPETIEKLRVASGSRKHTPETREKMRKSHTGKKLPESTKQKLRISSTGRRHPEAAKEKVRASKASPELRAAVSAKMKAHWANPETAIPHRNKINEAKRKNKEARNALS